MGVRSRGGSWARWASAEPPAVSAGKCATVLPHTSHARHNRAWLWFAPPCSLHAARHGHILPRLHQLLGGVCSTLLAHTLILSSPLCQVHLDDYGSVEEAYLAGKRRLAATASKLTNQNAPQLLNGRVSLSLSKRPRTATSNMSKEEFLGAVQQTKEYIQVRHWLAAVLLVHA